MWYNRHVMGKRAKNVLLLGGPYMQNYYSRITALAMERGWYLEMDERYNPPHGWRGDGVIAMLFDVPVMNRFLDDVLSRGIPVVNIIGVSNREDLGHVFTDESALGRMAAEHFRERNFTRAAFFAPEWTSLHERRYRAFADAFCELRPEKWRWPAERGQARDRLALADWAARTLAAARKPVAVLTFNAYNASFLARVCNDRRISVPHEVAILSGFENPIHTTHKDMPISAIRHDSETICTKAVNLLQRMMDGRASKTSSVAVPPLGIAVRRSTDAVAAEDPVLRAAMSFICANMSKPFGPAQVADKVGVSLERLNRLVRRELGRSMLDEILCQRISAAKRLMADSSLKISAIANETGFCNASYFCKTFREAEGVSPHHWRATAKQGPSLAARS